MLADLLLSLRSDLGDPEGERFTDVTLTRCVWRAMPPVTRDLGLAPMKVAEGEILPEPTGEVAEMLVLLAAIHACQVMRAQTASNFAFSSGDKRVDKSSQAKSWAELETTLQQQYDQRVQEINPGMETGQDGYLLQPPRMAPVLYEQGSDV